MPAAGFRPQIHGLGPSRTSRRPLLHTPIRRRGAQFVLAPGSGRILAIDKTTGAASEISTWPSEIPLYSLAIKDCFPDSDLDGMPDFWEDLHGLDQNDRADADADVDGDGLTNLEEYQAATDPTAADSDGDGATDLEEILAGTDPNAPTSTPEGPPSVPASSPLALAILGFGLVCLARIRTRWNHRVFRSG